ncbi:MAG: hypothetical protein M0P13_12270 [Fibrobacteraceae bacterium]|nr:hypothetical protein [Fibrobacteraceae bacterium]
MEQRDTATISGNASHWWTKVSVAEPQAMAKQALPLYSAFATVVSQSGEERPSRASQVANLFAIKT